MLFLSANLSSSTCICSYDVLQQLIYL